MDAQPSEGETLEEGQGSFHPRPRSNLQGVTAGRRWRRLVQDPRAGRKWLRVLEGISLLRIEAIDALPKRAQLRQHLLLERA